MKKGLHFTYYAVYYRRVIVLRAFGGILLVEVCIYFLMIVMSYIIAHIMMTNGQETRYITQLVEAQVAL
jgi:hypothetical protein